MNATELSKASMPGSSNEANNGLGTNGSPTGTHALASHFGAPPANAMVYVVDDDTSSRELLAALLRADGINTLTYASATEFLAAYTDDATQTHCIITDLCMPEVDGLVLQQRLTSAGVRIPVIFVSGMGNVDAAVDAMKFGAVDFLQKPVDSQRLLTSVRRALSADQNAARQYCQRKHVEERLVTLTPREREVMDLLVQARGTKEIATDLKISVKTVFVHRARVMEKMGVDSLVQLSHIMDNHRPGHPRINASASD